MSKEIIQKQDKGSNLHLHAAFENHLATAMIKPKGKFKTRNNWFPDGRFFEDYFWKHFKVLRTLDVVGFTLNPEHVQGISI